MQIDTLLSDSTDISYFTSNRLQVHRNFSIAAVASVTNIILYPLALFEQVLTVTRLNFGRQNEYRMCAECFGARTERGHASHLSIRRVLQQKACTRIDPISHCPAPLRYPLRGLGLPDRSCLTIAPRLMLVRRLWCLIVRCVNLARPPDLRIITLAYRCMHHTAA